MVLHTIYTNIWAQLTTSYGFLSVCELIEVLNSVLLLGHYNGFPNIPVQQDTSTYQIWFGKLQKRPQSEICVKPAEAFPSAPGI